MNIQVNTGHNIEGGQDLNAYIESSLSEHFERFQSAITRIEVHLSDENAGKTGANDKRCLLEARVSHHTPVVVSHHADTVHEAVEGASAKLRRSLNDMVGKLTDHTSAKELLAAAEETAVDDTESELSV